MRDKLLALLLFTGGGFSVLTMQLFLTHLTEHPIEPNQALLKLQLQTQQLDRRVHALERHAHDQVGTSRISGPSHRDLCTSTQRLSNLSSKALMLAAGWQIEMDEVHPNNPPGGFQGWAADKQVGALSVIFQVPGKVAMKVKNVHPPEDPLNKVYVRMNDEPVAFLLPMQQQELCVQVQVDDELRIEEVFGLIMLSSFKFDCIEEGESAAQTSSAFSVSTTNVAPCAVGQKVWHLGSNHKCDRRAQEWISGRIDKVLNESFAVVQLEASSDRLTKFVALPVGRIFTAPNVDAAHCANMLFKRSVLDIITVADAKFAKEYELQINSQRCYADAHGYGHVLLEPGRYQACQKINIFFQKPCLVAQYLAEHPDGYMAVFLDADTVALVLERGLEEWLRIDADLHFYERDFLPEIMSGLFLVRNKPWVRRWLITWSEFFFRQPLGFSSADNGALHQHLVETMDLHGSERCGEMYAGLVSGVENRTPYWEFVECTNQILGPPATHRMCASSGSNECGLVTIWPRLNFLVIDCFVLDYSASIYVGPIFLHGVKKAEDVKNRYYRDINKCQVRKSALRTKEEYGQLALKWAKFCPQFFPTLSSTCSQCVDRCTASFTCTPLSLGEDPREVISAKMKLDLLRHVP